MFNEMPTLQPANQHRQSSWSFDIKEEGSIVSTKRKEGGKAKRTVYENECKVCGKNFTAESKRQPYCSSKCYGVSASVKKTNPLSKIECIRCLGNMGFGCKIISKKFYKTNHATVRKWIRNMGIAPSTSKISATRIVHSSIRRVDFEKIRKESERQKTIVKIEKKIKRAKLWADQIQKAIRNYGIDFDWRNASRLTILYWAKIEDSRADARCRAKKRIIVKGSHNHIKKICSRMLRRAIKVGYKKKQKTMHHFGCSTNELMSHLQSKFKSGMNWNNYGKIWEVDHIVPCDSFNLTDDFQVRLCNHFTNLQPMLVHLNRRKSNKFIGNPVQLQIL